MSLRVDSRPSASSTNTTQGAALRARENTASTSLGVSPKNFDWMVAMLTTRKEALELPATAFASMVLPVPGGPMSSTPLVPLPASVWAYRWGWVRGRMASRLMASIWTDNPPRSSNVVFKACLGTRSPNNCISNLLRVF